MILVYLHLQFDCSQDFGDLQTKMKLSFTTVFSTGTVKTKICINVSLTIDLAITQLIRWTKQFQITYQNFGHKRMMHLIQIFYANINAKFLGIGIVQSAICV